MELSAGQRKIAFAVIVFVLAALGVYLFTSTHHNPATASGGHGHGAGTGGAGTTAPPPSPSATSSTPSAVTQGPSPSASVRAITAPDIYQWLPFSQSGLGRAATTALRFGTAYATFSYTESTSAYLRTLHGLANSQVTGQIGAAYAAPGVAKMRTSRKQISSGSAQITSLRAYGSTSITFVLNITENITATQGGGPQTSSYALTLTGGGGNWQVSSIELASLGNT
jgi:hypothetical protein